MSTVEELLPEYLVRQRWYAGTTAPEKVRVEHRDDSLADAGMLHLLVDADGTRYQLLFGRASEHEVPAFLHGHDFAVLGVAEEALLYDAVLDPHLMLSFLTLVAPGEEAERVRPVGVEQSNSSVVYDDRIILKVFRRVGDHPNPDIAITEALTRVGFEHVAAPRGAWRFEGMDLAFAQDYLSNGFEGWQLALTSLRDLYASQCEDPADAGGDFASEARRLGRVTAELHVAMAEAFGVSAGDPEVWASGIGPRPSHELERTVERFRAIDDPGRAIRVHGDYHLGQTMRTDSGWYVLDFEGEPARSLEERSRPTSPLKDVAGMLRSFHYATAVALREQEEAQREDLAPLAEAWERRNAEAFVRGYRDTDGIGELLPRDEASWRAVLDGFILEKAIYELAYEEQYRPDWVPIPTAALNRLVRESRAED